MDDKTKMSQKLATKNILPQVHLNKIDEIKDNIDKEAATRQIRETLKNSSDTIGPDGKPIQEIPINKEIKMVQ